MDYENLKYIASRYFGFIEGVYKHQNMTDTPYLKDRISKETYHHMFEDVAKMIMEYPDEDIETYRKMLYDDSKIEFMIKRIVYSQGQTPGMVLNFGTKLNRDVIVCGNMQEVNINNNKIEKMPISMKENTIFDLASTSKLFTSLSILKLCEAGLISLDDPIRKHVPEFQNLGNITIFELLTFTTSVKTTSRLNDAKSPEEALHILYTLEKNNAPNKMWMYSDMGAMCLRVLVERVAKMSFKDFVNEEILRPCNMNNTFLNVPRDLRGNVANENYSSVVDANGNIQTRFTNIPGTAHDPKANIIGHQVGIAPGHAGYFSNASDMTTLAKAIMEGKVINEEHTKMLAQNHVGEKLQDENGNDIYSQHLGALTYTKQGNSRLLGVPSFLSGGAFLSPGFGGTFLCVDKLNGAYSFLGSNRLHNRIYSIPQEYAGQIKQDIYGEKTYTDPSLNKQVVSSTYTKDVGVINYTAMELALKYRLLELMLNQKKELTLKRYI